MSPIVGGSRDESAPPLAGKPRTQLNSQNNNQNNNRTLAEVDDVIDTIDHQFSVLPQHEKTRQGVRSHLRKFLNWAAKDYGLTLDYDDLVPVLTDYGAVQNYIDACQGKKKPSTLQQELRVLNRIVSKINQNTNSEGPEDENLWEPEPFGLGQPSQAPSYTPQEIRDIKDWIENRPSGVSRDRATAIVSLALGAGFTTGEIVHVTANDVSNDRSHIIVRTPGTTTTRARSVPVTAPWDSHLHRIVEAARHEFGPNTYVISPESQTRNSSYPALLVTRFLEKTTTQHSGGLMPTIGRLRHTWVLEHVAHRVPYELLDSAAGIHRGVKAAYKRTILSSGLMQADEFHAWTTGLKTEIPKSHPRNL
ncbi:hypothetical protein ACXZ66_01775 [Corynebacterium sp. S7]